MATHIPIYQVDAFADRVFTGNPAAICPLEEWLPDEVMQAIAAENNLSETAFFVPRLTVSTICAGSRQSSRLISAATRRWHRGMWCSRS